jgi:hypothetical protein
MPSVYVGHDVAPHEVFLCGGQRELLDQRIFVRLGRGRAELSMRHVYCV